MAFTVFKLALRRITLKDLRKSENLHRAIVGAFAFAFLAAGLLPYVPDIPLAGGDALVYSAAVALGGLLGKAFAA